jgi:hypothetical protein
VRFVAATFGLEWEWSGGFEVENVGTLGVRVRRSRKLDNPPTQANTSGNKSCRNRTAVIVRREVVHQGASLLVVFQPELRSLPPFRLVNRTGFTMRFHQEWVAVNTVST